MGYHIYAWLDEGQPKLRIIDAGSDSVCLDWSYQGGQVQDPNAKKEIQRLFRDLLLLTCRQSLSPERGTSLSLGPADSPAPVPA
ncbi:MAG: hypothetical protein PVG91_00205 [Gammaproteobacteria bacterium]|jgi:hypothetical protein